MFQYRLAYWLEYVASFTWKAILVGWAMVYASQYVMHLRHPQTIFDTGLHLSRLQVLGLYCAAGTGIMLMLIGMGGIISRFMGPWMDRH